jgi:hypothetical protein
MGLGLAGNSALNQSGASPSVSVADFGTDPTGHKDSTAGVAAALAYLASKGKQTLVFPSGTYRLDSARQAAISLNNQANITIDGKGSTLLMGNDCLCLAFDRCTNLILQNLTIDWRPLPYTQGTVSGSGIGWFEATLDAGFPAVPRDGILAIEAYDRSPGNFAKDGFLLSGEKVLQVSPLNGNCVRIRCVRLTPIPVGTAIVVRFKGNHDAIRLTQCRDVSFAGVTLHSSPSMGYNIALSSNLSFQQCTIGPPATSQRHLSTNADGIHITNCSGSLVINQCTFEGMGDDAININAPLWHLQKQASGPGAVLMKRSGSALAPEETPAPQDPLEVMDSGDLHIVQHGTLSQLATAADNLLVADPARVPVTAITHCQFHDNHARAIVAHARLQVRNCTFQKIRLAAILIAPDDHWMEGPSTRDIVIDSNHFSACHYGSRDPEGAVTIDMEQTYGRRGAVLRGSSQDVQITNNVFTECYTSAISARSVDGLEIRGNQVAHTWIAGPGGAAIEASALKHSAISNNTSSCPNTIAVKDSESTSVAGNQGFS